MRGSEPGAGLEQIQTEMAEWGRRSWPDANTTSEGLALAEEVGELARCIVKRQHGTRGTAEEWTAELRKEVGDVALVLAFIADLEGWSLAECIADRWATIRQRDWVANPLGHGIPTDAPPAAAAPVGGGEPGRREAALEAAILDIDAHATPFGEDDDGFVSGGYLISVGSLHRALGVVGHAAVKCPDCPHDHPNERQSDRFEAALREIDALRPDDFKTGQGHLSPAFREVSFRDAFREVIRIVNGVLHPSPGPPPAAVGGGEPEPYDKPHERPWPPPPPPLRRTLTDEDIREWEAVLDAERAEDEGHAAVGVGAEPPPGIYERCDDDLWITGRWERMADGSWRCLDDPAPTPAAAPLDEPPLNVADATGQCNHCEAPVWNDATMCWNCGGPSVAQFAPAPAPVEDAQEPPVEEPR